MLAILETHPIQYHAPVYRALQQRCGIPVTAIYGSDFSVSGYRDKEFGADFSWDTDLLSGYESRFLSRVQSGGAKNSEDVSTRGLRRVLAELNPSAVLLPGYSPRFYRRACFLAVRARRPILFRGETTDHATRRGRLKSWARDFALRSLYARCSRLLYVGEQSAHHFERLGFARSSLVFSPYCVDVSPFECDEAAREKHRAHTREQIRAAAHDFVLLFSGKLSERKGPDLLLDAVQKLSLALQRRLVLLFVGDGELRSSLEARCCPSTVLASQDSTASAFRVRAHFPGFKNQREISPYFHAADALVLPSRHGETWGLVVNEALHHGIPAVVSDAVGCAPDLIVPSKTGECFATGSVEDLARAIERVVNYPSSATARTQCRAQVSGYSIDAAAEGIATAYHRITE